jgi:integrase
VLPCRGGPRWAPTFKEWVTEYLEMVKETKSKAGYGADKLYLGRAEQMLGKRKLEKLKPNDIRRFFESQKEKGDTTANRALASIRACLSAAWRLDMIPENVALKVKPLPEKPPRSRVLTDDEMSRLMDAVEAVENPHVRAAFLMMIHTGCRRSEALRARWEDLDLSDLDSATWRIPRPKSGRPEVKPITKYLAKTLTELPRAGRYVIAGRYPTRPRADLKRWWKDISKAAELADVTMHDIRRSYGLAVTRAAGLHVASKLLGHSTVRVTERVYAPPPLPPLPAPTPAFGLECRCPFSIPAP